MKQWSIELLIPWIETWCDTHPMASLSVHMTMFSSETVRIRSGVCKQGVDMAHLTSIHDDMTQQCIRVGWQHGFLRC